MSVFELYLRFEHNGSKEDIAFEFFDNKKLILNPKNHTYIDGIIIGTKLPNGPYLVVNPARLIESSFYPGAEYLFLDVIANDLYNVIRIRSPESSLSSKVNAKDEPISCSTFTISSESKTEARYLLMTYDGHNAYVSIGIREKPVEKTKIRRRTKAN